MESRKERLLSIVRAEQVDLMKIEALLIKHSVGEAAGHGFEDMVVLSCVESLLEKMGEV